MKALLSSANSYVLYLLYVTEWIVLIPQTLVTGRDLSRVGLRVSPVVEFIHEANDKKTDIVLTAVNNLNGIMMFSFVVGQCTNNLNYGCSTLSLW